MKKAFPNRQYLLPVHKSTLLQKQTLTVSFRARPEAWGEVRSIWEGMD